MRTRTAPQQQWMVMDLEGRGLLTDDRAPRKGRPSAPPPSAEEVARQVVRQLVLPEPVIRMSPDEEAAQVVHVPTWLWVDRSVWRPVSKTAQVPGMTVTATATPRAVEWSMGDGATVVCAGPGTPYATKFAAASGSPDCGHTYARSSAGQPEEAFPVRAAITWDVVWRGDGRSGVIRGLRSATRIPVKVTEVQALVVDRGRRG
ncbi:hypothetical protein [Actinacidiphila sp. bgisy167]|uniref:hypothetical protein n=1 Tax=Actinacidiphila sp. bgisy167 TaxID=3413797 RepID=UPI003D734DC6